LSDALDLGHGVNRGTYRRLDRSLEWRAIEAQKLAAQPTCERCGNAPAVEAHHVDGCTLTTDPEYLIEHAQSVCLACHDAACPTRARTAFDSLLDRIL
jgi:hypothetical protein